MTEERDLHPNLAAALEGGEADAAELEAVARLLANLPTLQAPPAGLFDAIAAEAFADSGAATPAEPAAPTSVADGARSLRPVEGTGEPAPRSRSAARRWPLLAAAAALAVILGIAGVVALGGSTDDPTEQQVELAALPGFEGAEGTALLVERDGDREVEVDLAGVDLPEGSHLEIWLLDPAVSQTISLGVLDDAGPFTVPADVDLVATPILDVSVEPDDGDPAHSGVSVVRGEIEPA
ncbi:MAG: anti-sigma factor [Acidimicrobiales bacterium]